jgi:hypothetical protein
MVTGAHKNVQGAYRDTLSFIFSATKGMDALDAAFSASACENINIIGDDGSESIYSGYTIRSGLSKAAVEISPETISSEAIYEDRITVSMSQRTYQETKIAEMEAAIAALMNK